MSKGRYGEYGGQYVPETLMNAVHEVEEAYEKYKNDPEFNRELDDLLKNYAGRPSLLYEAKKMTRDLGGAKIYLKREDLNHTGAHKINNVLGQVLLAKKMGKTRVIAETGAGQYVPITDEEAVNAFEYLSRTEGIIPAVESAHAIAYAMKLAPTMDKDKIIVVTVSGRGDKDVAAIARYRGVEIYE